MVNYYFPLILCHNHLSIIAISYIHISTWIAKTVIRVQTGGGWGVGGRYPSPRGGSTTVARLKTMFIRVVNSRVSTIPSLHHFPLPDDLLTSISVPFTLMVHFNRNNLYTVPCTTTVDCTS